MVNLVPMNDKNPVIVTTQTQAKKLGNCAATYVSQATCPFCVFKGAGCYAEAGVFQSTTYRLNNSRVTDPIEIAKIEAAKIDELTEPRDLRVHVVGDCATAAAAEIVGAAMVRFEARTGRRAWTYTHAWMDVPVDAWKGARVMASCETLEHVREATAMGYAAAIVVPEYLNGDRAYLSENVRIVPCPYETRGVTCDKCRLCMRPENLKKTGAVIAFKSHATKAKLVSEIVKKAVATPTR